jgi:plasmid maintenance system antidote protein VapI
MTLPEILRQHIADRLAAGESISEIARRAELQQPTLSRFVSGQRDLTAEKAGKLIEALGGRVVWKKSGKKSGEK